MEIYFILFFPVVAGVIVALVNSITINHRIDGFIIWVENKKTSITNDSGKFSRFLFKPTYWAILNMCKLTSKIKNDRLRYGVRTLSFLYTGYIFAYILFAIGFVILFLIAFIFFIWLVLRFTLYKDEDDYRTYSPSNEINKEKSLLNLKHYDREGKKTGYSRETYSIFGRNVTEHFDESYNKTGYTKKENGIMGGEYEQHYNRNGQKIGRSAIETGLLGDEFIQHYNYDGKKIGYSKKEKGILGDESIVHYDQSGNKIGESKI
jgi:hypothetical protein